MHRMLRPLAPAAVTTFALAFILAFVVCGSAVARAAAGMPFGEWQVEWLDGRPLPTKAGGALTIQQDGTIDGSGGCNRFHGHATIKGPSISFGQVAATERACLDDGAMKQEQQFFAALNEIRSWRLQASGRDGEPSTRLILLDAKNNERMTLRPATQRATITIPVPGVSEVQSQRVIYVCGKDNVTVDYINAGDVSLAVLTMKDAFVVAANVIAASGARYAGRQFIWWNKGKNADLYDLMKGKDAKPVACHEAP